jgi:O-Antigen ligase
MVQRLVCVLVFSVLTAEYPFLWENHWSTPWHFIADLIFAPIPGIRLWFMDGFIFALLFAGRAQKGARQGRAKPMETATLVSLGSLIVWCVWGAIGGGSVLDMRLQLHEAVMLVFMAFMYTNTLRTPEHYRMLGNTVIYAALFRFVMMFVFYITIMRSLTVPVATVTDHGDSILFVTALVIAVANGLHARTRAATRNAVIISVLMLWCIQINNRRLAYVGVIGSAVIIYALLPVGPIRRKIHRALLIAAPIAALYVAIGWSRPTGIFKPVASIQSMNDPADLSTQSRILENMGLIVTLQTAPVIGSGFGHKYIEISDALAAKEFPQYRYVPHNSALGLAAFTGAFGFVGIWMMFPVAAYFASRSYQFARDPLEKSIAMVCVCEVLIHINQMWGDIGINAPQGVVLMGAAFAASSRMAVRTGAWPGAQKRSTGA